MQQTWNPLLSPPHNYRFRLTITTRLLTFLFTPKVTTRLAHSPSPSDPTLESLETEPRYATKSTPHPQQQDSRFAYSIIFPLPPTQAAVLPLPFTSDPHSPSPHHLDQLTLKARTETAMCNKLFLFLRSLKISHSHTYRRSALLIQFYSP